MTIADLETTGYTAQVAFALEDGTDVYQVTLDGVLTTYVRDDDSDAIAALIEIYPDAALQIESPAAAIAMAQLQHIGYTVTRPDPTQNIFDVTGGTTSLTGQTPDQIAALDLPSLLPPPPPSAASVAMATALAAIANDPALDPATQQAIQKVVSDLDPSAG